MMLAFVGTEVTKAEILAQLRAHAKADEIIQGTTWEDGKGCAVGCTLHAYNHALYESRFGIPQMLARLEDSIFEGLPNVEAQKWPVRFMSAIPEGADLSRVGWQFLHWLLTDVKVNPGIDHPIVRDAVKRCARVVEAPARGQPIDKDAAAAAESAARAARAAESAAWAAGAAAAARAARAAESAAWAAGAAAAAWAAWAAAAARAAWAAESAAWAAGAAAWAAAWARMSRKLLALLRAAPVPRTKKGRGK